LTTMHNRNQPRLPVEASWPVGSKRIRAYPSGRTAIGQRVKACAAILLESSMNIREINHELGGS
jgi:hypothetical protein